LGPDEPTSSKGSYSQEVFFFHSSSFSYICVCVWDSFFAIHFRCAHKLSLAFFSG
jgi:hypothetical protein